MTNRIRSAAAALLFLVCLVTLTSAFNFPNRSSGLSSQLASLSMAAKPAQQRTTLTLADRVAYQRAIEEVYWRHRIWPKERPDPKPSLDEVMPPAQLEKKVEDYLRKSQALENYWQRPITAEQLQAEMDRMAQHTKQPEVLRELFEALGNDPFVIAECLARPALSERLLTNFYTHDERFHGELNRRAEAELRTHYSIEQMKQISGNYSEIEWVKSDNTQDEENRRAEPSVKLNSREWDKNLQSLAATFDKPSTAKASAFGVQRHVAASESADISAHSKNAAAQAYEALPTGKLSPLQEDEERYYATAVVKKSKDRLKLAAVSWPKEPWESWLTRTGNQVPTWIAVPSSNYTLPTTSDVAGGCIDDTWTPTAGSPDARSAPTAVWTGSEMIIWGGLGTVDVFNTGGKYNPTTDTWTPTTITNAPSRRVSHTAVWTGTEMIVWGGYFFEGSNRWLNTGGRYNPGTDTWIATSLTNAPTARYDHTAVWTGGEMIVWGGVTNSTLNTGGKYNPITNSWIATSLTNVPTPRDSHTAVWTGGEMIVWGGYSFDVGDYLNTGGRYNPSADSWTATSTTNAPAARESHTAVWSGSEVIVWGGNQSGNPLNTGGRYNPNTDSWIATSTVNAPSARDSHTAVWTGNEMIVWGGTTSNTGGRYNPGANSWIATSTVNAPNGRYSPAGVWTGSEMIVWGGYDGTNDLNTGGKYNPSADSWTVTSTANVPRGRYYHTAVWTGSEMIVWGGRTRNFAYLNTGGIYDPSIDSWTATSTTTAPSGRIWHTAVWTGSEMIIWGGFDQSFNDSNTGGRYNPSTDSWIATSITNAPDGRDSHAAVWTGGEMIVWGGYSSSVNGYLNTGGRYNPGADTWTATSTAFAPSGRAYHTAVWTGNEMIVWGGYFNDGSDHYLNSGGRYNSGTDSWTATSTANAPSGRDSHGAVWTGGQMIVWGGYGDTGYLDTGGRYDPGADSWTTTTTVNAPEGRTVHGAVWTGNEMIVWGGYFFDGNDHLLNTGGRYNPEADSWTATSPVNALAGRTSHTAVWTGSKMVVWGGRLFVNVGTSTGGRYCAQSQAPMAQSAFSRKVHGAAGTFDIPLPLTGNVGVECRSGGATNDYQMIINFMNSVTVGSASVTSGTGSVSSFSVSGSQVTVNLTGVTNLQRITVTLFNVNDGTHMGNVPVSMGVLVGDVNGNALVNASDVSLAKSQVGHAVSSSNFREDVNANGVINSVDVALVKARVGTALPP